MSWRLEGWSTRQHRTSGCNLKRLSLFDWREVAFRERTAGPGLQIAFEARSRRSIAKLHRHENPPRAMRNSVPRWAFVMPSEPLINVRGATDVVTRRIALTPEDVNEALADAFHDERGGIPRASENAVNFVRESHVDTRRTQITEGLNGAGMAEVAVRLRSAYAELRRDRLRLSG